MRITVLAGGIGGARFLRGVRAGCPGDQLTAVVNTGDDVTLHGLRICPDLDSVMYTLGDGIDTERGWGREKESWRIKEELDSCGDCGRQPLRPRSQRSSTPATTSRCTVCGSVPTSTR